MMIRRIFLSGMILLIPLLARADRVGQNLDIVRSKVNQAVQQYLIGIYGEQKLARDIVFRASTLDPRLKLSKCDNHIQAQVKETSHSAKSLSVKVQCLNATPWTIYVPASVDIFVEVAVSNRNLHRGEELAADDFVFKRMNTSNISQAYLDQNTQLLGKEVRRALRAGSVIKKQDLKEPTLIAKGEVVLIFARHGALEVKSEATALANGHLGQQIKVQNLKTKRVVEARVTGKGLAEVLL